MFESCTGKAYSHSDPETSSDSEEDALRRLNSGNHMVTDSLTIQTDVLGDISTSTFCYVQN